MNAAFALGLALGVAPVAIAELLPAIEAEMVSKTNDKLGGGQDG